MVKTLFLAIIPLFVAVDAIGILPVFVSLTGGMKYRERSRVIRKSLLVAFALSIGFIFVGKSVFRFLNITVPDFMVAGGILLFFIAIIDLLNPDKKTRVPGDELGAVPLGTPLIVGPAVLTTSLLLLDTYGLVPTLVSVVVNIMIVGVVLLLSDFLIRLLGSAGARALSKITSILLSAIAVMMVRKGILFMINP